jgi:hypothetical protein
MFAPHEDCPVELEYTELKATAARLRIWSKWPECQSIVDATLCGPNSRFSQTLPARYKFKPLSKIQVANHAWTVVCPDPCYWSQSLPFDYEIRLKLRKPHSSEEDIIEQRLCIALKRYAVREKSLWCDGERVVLRGISLDPSEFQPAPWTALRAQRTTIICRQPLDQILQAGMDHGIPLLWDCRSNPPREQELYWVRRQGAVCGIMINHTQISHISQSCRIDPVVVWMDVNTGAEWGKFMKLLADYTMHQHNIGLMLNAETIQELPQEVWQSILNLPYPKAIRTVTNSSMQTWSDRRAACDVLQARTAKYGNFAAYCVIAS